MALVALFHHAARVEHGVVDPDGEADDHHELGDVGRERLDLAERAEQAHRARDGGGAEHQRHAGGDECAEGDEQDDQHQAVGDEVRLLAVLGVLGGDLLGRGDLAELLDANAGVRLLNGGDGRERLVDELLDLLVAAAQREVHGDGPAVLRDGVDPVGRVERALDLRDPRDRAESAHDVLDGRGDLRVIDALALDQHLLAGLVGETGGRDEHVAPLGLAAAGRRLVDLVQADPSADDGGEHDEQDPAEDGRLAVLRAPSTGSRGEITGLIQRPVLLQGAGGTGCSLPGHAARRGWQPGVSRGRWRPRRGRCPHRS